MPPPVLIFQLSTNFALLMAERYLILSLRSAVKSGSIRRQQMTYEDVTGIGLNEYGNQEIRNRTVFFHEFLSSKFKSAFIGLPYEMQSYLMGRKSVARLN